MEELMSLRDIEDPIEINKEMSVDEFWNILEKTAHYNRDVWGLDGILNLLVDYFNLKADQAKEMHRPASEVYEKYASRLFDALDSRGYFKS